VGPDESPRWGSAQATTPRVRGWAAGAAAIPEAGTMTRLQPDPTFYPSPRLAMQAPQEQLAYVTTINPTGKGRPDALCVLDVAPDSPTYCQVVGRLEMP